MKRLSFAVAATAAVAASCRSHDVVRKPDFSFNRMQQQPRYDTYASSSFFDDGKAMREPPNGTVPYSRESALGPPVDGVVDGEYVTRFPVPVTRQLVALGRSRYDSICGNCHGIRGDGDTVVATYMARKPPSLHEVRIRTLPQGRIYRVIREGYGLMPSYAAHVTKDETWAVVAYVRALERSQYAIVARLPPEIAAELARAVP